ncbi:putative UDP-N-acetylglucosamine--peptide N-acetylglucosaminyltransferase SEC [Apostasia shenzhenica]|uniref:Putative UDP-N-acetylglucosamine--peptide N-acetylglucosaminyltransferase SEC n=1 Tax=Apostasia shenzhenica TaxID=1088818 RepID=A0A2I0AAY0_9ASPA|nr:putative UDP-N-acetylglucosamine--peptide N-acetylglucosaminyltransferase SEC [Apostasia shenzhenica]
MREDPWAIGASEKASEVEVKPDDGDIQEAESSLREGLSLNYEEARALLGRLEYHRGNVEAALRVFDGIDLQAATHRLQSSISDKHSPRKTRYRNESPHSTSQHATSLVLEAIFLKAMSLQKLGRAFEAAQECRNVLDAVEKIFHHGIPDFLVENKLQETVSKSVEILPELWKEAGKFQEALASYRRALLGQWNLEEECCVRIQKRFVILLLYGGVEAGPLSLAAQTDDSFVPKNNLEEAILLLMILLKKWNLGRIQWDASLMDHLSFALSQCSQTTFLSKQFEEVLPGIYPRRDRWYTLALCHSGAGEAGEALNLLRKCVNKYENPSDLRALLLAAKICSGDCLLASEGVYYARCAIMNAKKVDEHLNSVGLRFLGICLGKKAKVSSSDQERSHLQAEALTWLEEAIVLDHYNSELIFDLGLHYAEMRNINAAIRCAKTFIDLTGGSVLKGWRLLALLLSAQERYLEAELVIDAALDETSKWEQGPLLRIKAKLKVAESVPMDAVEAYRVLLALVQAQRKSFGSFKSGAQIEGDKVSEFEVWHDLAGLYARLSQWKDVELCLEKAAALIPYAATTLHTEGSIHEARSDMRAAMSSYISALSVDPHHVPTKISLSSLLLRSGSKPSTIVRSFLSDALRLEPTNRQAWYYLGVVYRDDGRFSDAADCFLAASMLEESEPIEGL